MSSLTTDESTGMGIWRQQLAKIVMRALVIFGGLTTFFAVYQAFIERNYLQLTIYLAIYVTLVAVTFLQSGSYRLQAIVAMVLFGAFSIFNLLQFGLNADSGIFLFTIPLIATLFFDKRGGRLAIVAVLLTMVGVAVLFVTDVVVVYNVNPTRSADWEGWAITSTLLLALSAGLVFAQNYLLDRLTDALDESRQLTQALEAERAGLENQVSERTRSAEMAREEAEDARRALEAQIWQVTGQAKLGEALRGEQDIAALADNVARQLCQYLDAQIGTLFVREADRLRPVGGYAHMATADTFRMGEGLVGQVALEDEPILVSNIPEGHLQIASGLGAIVPRHVLISPFAYEGDTIGVVEIGALSPFTSVQKTLVADAMESIAVAFNTAKTRTQIDELLTEMQQQTEELQAQEEELRAANEELETQMESLRTSQTRLREKQEELEALNAELQAEKASRRQL